MAILIFVLALILLIAAAASGYQSLNLLPIGIGVLYALAAAVAACAAVLTFAVAILIRRVDALTALVRQSALPSAVTAGLEIARVRGTEPAGEVSSAAPHAGEEETPAENESPININRAGHLPSLETAETAVESPEPKRPPSLIGSYSSAGANYKIYSDGSIEAETSDGTFKFASMADFKRHLAETKGGPEAGA